MLHFAGHGRRYSAVFVATMRPTIRAGRGGPLFVGGFPRGLRDLAPRCGDGVAAGPVAIRPHKADRRIIGREMPVAFVTRRDAVAGGEGGPAGVEDAPALRRLHCAPPMRPQ